MGKFMSVDDHMVVIFDIDDCLMPWAETVHLKCIEAGIALPGSSWTKWSMWEDYGSTKEAWLEVVNAQVTPGGLYHQPPYPGVLEAIDDLWQAGHEVHLVTARGFFDHAEQIRAWTEDWVSTYHIPSKLHFAKDKGRVAKEIGATHAIDDAMHNIEDLVKAGVDAYLMTQPHNAGLYYRPDRRVPNVPEFVKRILW